MSSKFNIDSTALEVVEGHDLTGYNVLVTGANSGIGVETVRALAKVGATVFMTARNVEKAQSVLDELVNSTGNKNIHLEQLELDSLDNVNAFVERFLAKDLPLHILINNAGVMACPLTYTKDGLENQFGINHIGHFALTMGLLSSLKRAYNESGRYTRVVNLSSTAHVRSDVDFNDINFKNREYEPFVAYGQSKTCNMLFSIGLTDRYKTDGIYSNAVMPGVIITSLQRHIPAMTQESLTERYPKVKTIPQGASTTVWAAIAKELDGKGGLYLEDCIVGKEVESTEEIYKYMLGYKSYCMNPESVNKLWELSEKIIKRN